MQDLVRFVNISQGNKIDAISSLHAKKEVLISIFKEGQWYLLSHFDVIVANPLDRFSNHVFQLEFLRKTTMDKVAPRKRCQFIDCWPLYRIKHASTVEKQFVVGQHLSICFQLCSDYYVAYTYKY